MGQAKICLDFSGVRSRSVGAAGPCIGFFLCFIFSPLGFIPCFSVLISG